MGKMAFSVDGERPSQLSSPYAFFKKLVDHLISQTIQMNPVISG
jgi:hypothetical protein